MELVIDTCVISSANDKKPYDKLSSKSRQALNEILENSHTLAVSIPIWTEYKGIRNNYGRNWLSIMTRKNRLHQIDNIEDSELRDYLSNCTRIYCPVSQYEAFFPKIEEDIHLLETALKSHHLIISNEKNCRDKIRNVVSNNSSDEQYKKLCKLVWIRPIDDCEIVQVFHLINKDQITELHPQFTLIP